jgi:hypothetical protein
MSDCFFEGQEDPRKKTQCSSPGIFLVSCSQTNSTTVGEFGVVFPLVLAGNRERANVFLESSYK